MTPRDFLPWQGGRELFQLIAESLDENLCPGDALFLTMGVGRGGRVRLLASATARRVTQLGMGRRGEEAPDVEALVQGKIPLAPSNDSHFDVVGPFIRPPRGVRSPWIAYIPDVQHRRLPDMFSAQERRERDREFDALLSGAALVLVNSGNVAKDLRRFYAPSRGEIVPLPFAACVEQNWFEAADDVRARYALDDPFFLCSNQFWKHKNHQIVLAAVALARREGRPIRFVLTGETRDYRHPDYFPDLVEEIGRLKIADDIRILGFIPKLDQIRLMQAAEAVVQPSLFEGGPGGGAIYNAVALGRPVIVSDLPVNREIEALVTHFFDPADPAQLLAKLRLIQATEFSPPAPATVLRQGEARKRDFGLALRQAFALAQSR